MNELLAETSLLNFNSANIKELIDIKGWLTLSEKEKILGIYNYVSGLL